MADGGGPRVTRYSAFISYSHADEDFARKLQRSLEAYRFPRKLLHARPDVPRRLSPVFRDRAELSAAADLTAAVRDALAGSRYLIAVCSARAASSDWVHREIAFFRELHGPEAVLAVLPEGAGPATLAALFGADVALPLAADFNKRGDGPRLALLKLVAALAGVGLDTLVQRDAQRRVHRMAWLGAGAVAGMAVMGVLTAVAVEGRRAAEREQARGAALVDTLLGDVRSNLKKVGRLDVLDPLNQALVRYYRTQNLKTLSADALEARAKLLQAMGADDETRGKLDEAHAQFMEARRTTGALLAAAPNDPKRIYAHAQSEYWMGLIAWRRGDFGGAEQGFRAYQALATRLTQIAPANPNYVLENGYASAALGMLLLRAQFRVPEAEAAFTQALGAIQSVAVRQPDNADLQVKVGVTYGWLADAERFGGDYDGAILHRSRARKIFADVLSRDGRNAEARTEFVSNRLGIGRIELARGDADGAAREFEAGAATANALVEADPTNRGARLEVRAFALFDAEAKMAAAKPGGFSATDIEREVGDCDGDRSASGSEELAKFCLLLRARALALLGEAQSARRLLASVKPSSQHERLTERWGLDLQAEAERTSTLLNGSGK